MGLFGIGLYRPIAQLPATNPLHLSTSATTLGELPGITSLLYTTDTLTRNPMGYWHLNDAGPSLLDASGHGFTGTMVGGASTLSSGPLLGPGEQANSGVTLDGSTGYLTFPGPSTSGWSALTVECWVNVTSLPNSFNPGLVMNSRTFSTDQGFEIVLASTSDGSTGYFIVGNGNTSFSLNFGVGSLPLNTWFYLAFVYDGAQLLAYVNGQPIGATPATLSLSAGTGPMIVGAYPDFSNKLNGTVAELTIWNSALSSIAIANRYQYGQSTGTTQVGAGFPSSPFGLTQPTAGTWGGLYGFLLYTTIRAPKTVVYTPAPLLGLDSGGNPIVRGFPQIVWNYSMLRPDYWYYLQMLYQQSARTPPGFQYLVLLQYPDQSGNNTPVQILAHWNPPVAAGRTVGAFQGVQLTFTYLGQTQLNYQTPIVILS